jgi:hypothetical protein
LNTPIQRTIHVTITRYKLNLPFSERRLLLFLGDIAMGSAAVVAAFWVNSLL